MIILRSNRHFDWSASLRDEEHDISTFTAYGQNAHAALESLLSELARAALDQRIKEETKKRNRKPAQVDGYIGIPKRQIS